MVEGMSIGVHDLNIFYRESGQGHPLILLHGATDTHALWEQFIPEFSEKYRVITPDTRGHGRTINPSDQLSYRMFADDLAGFIQALELNKPLIFGYSDGGQAALDLGIRYPGLAGALVLGGVWFRFSKEYQNSIKAAGFTGAGEIDFRIFEQNAPADWRERMGLIHSDPRKDYPEILLRNLAELFWTPLNYSEHDLGKISTPTLILMGENDENVPLDEARELAALIPGAELAVIPDATHSGVFRYRDQMIKIVLDFLAQGLEP